MSVSLKTRLEKIMPPATAKELEEALLPLFDKYKHLEGQKALVLFSGGLDTSFITHFLTHIIGAKVTTLSADVGSVTSPVNREEVAERSREVGATEHVNVDCRDALAELGMAAMRAEAQLGNGYGHPPASSLSRVVMCEAAVKTAKEKNIVALFHGSNGSQNNPYRFHSALKYYQQKEDYEIEECTPNLGATTVSRDREQTYLEAAGITIKAQSFEENVSHDRNLLGDEWEEARIANPDNIYDMRSETLGNIPVPAEPQRLGIRFEKGTPVALKMPENEDFVPMTPRQIIETLNAAGLPYHIGMYDYSEGRPIGVRAREVHISPAMSILIKAHNWLKAYQFDDYTNAKLNALSQHWARWVMEKNLYVHPERRVMDSIFESFNADLNGEVTLTLEQEKITNLTSPHAAMHAEGTKLPATATQVQEYLGAHTPEAVSARYKDTRRYVASLPAGKRPKTMLRVAQLQRRHGAVNENNDLEPLLRLERLEAALHRLNQQDIAFSI